MYIGSIIRVYKVLLLKLLFCLCKEQNTLAELETKKIRAALKNHMDHNILLGLSRPLRAVPLSIHT